MENTDKVKEFVQKYVSINILKDDCPIPLFDVIIVWQCYILGYQKWLVITTLPDEMYYEVTYNKEKDEFYLDAYKKVDNMLLRNTYKNEVTE